MTKAGERESKGGRWVRLLLPGGRCGPAPYLAAAAACGNIKGGGSSPRALLPREMQNKKPRAAAARGAGRAGASARGERHQRCSAGVLG